MRLTRRLACAAVAAIFISLTAGAAAAGAQSAPRQRPCPGQAGFNCGTLTVPLDWSQRVPGTIGIKFAAQRGGRRTRKLMIALSGGPGQAGVDSAAVRALALEPALSRYRVAVLDQRGTGGSGVLRCPNVQRLRDLDPFRPGALAGCAARIGTRRAFYTTSDSVLDIDALRRALGADKVALMGVSYGTHVALQYARAFPQNVDSLILDSVVGPDGPDPFLLDTFRSLPRVLRDQCRGSRCRGITSDPVADVAALVSRLNTRGPLRGSFYDARGRRRSTRYAIPDELASLLIAGDLNPVLRAALPGAIAAARRGDTAALMRLRRVGQGSGLETRELSYGVLVATGCLDVPLPYSLATPGPARPAIAQAALAAIPPAQYAPFDPQTLLRLSYVEDCMLWPADVARPPFTGPLPDVPALLVAGRLDLRTPAENATATAARLPHASVVTLAGAGHDPTDSDMTGCISRALTRFVARRAVGNPCRGRDNGIDPIPAPPRSLSDFRSAPGVGGTRGRALFAVLNSVEDAIITAAQLEGAGLPPSGGGLRGGRFAFSGVTGNLRLRRYRFVPGLRVSGTVRTGESELTGRLTVEGPRGTSGFIRLTRTGATGRLGGRNVRFRARGGASAAAAGGGGRTAGLPVVPPQLRRPAARVAVR